MLIYLIIFIFSFGALFLSSNFLVDALTKVSKFLGWKEFVVSFFIMAFATTVPNFFVDMTAALQKVPQLAFSDVIGTNIADLTLIVAISALVSRAGLSVPSRTVQGSSLFTIVIALLPLILIQDGTLSRIDGFLLLIAFIFYLIWLFQKRERFTKVYENIPASLNFRSFLKNIIFLFLSLFLLLLSGQGIVKSAVFFSNYFHLPLTLIGILVVGLGTALPELSFTLQAARKGEDWMVLGDVLGSVVFTTTLVLGVIAVISPITINNLSPFIVAGGFLIISALFFLFCVRSGQKITRKEAVFLLLIYFAFVAVEILTR